MASGRLDIIAKILTALTGITTGNGYNETVVTVEKVLRSWDDMGAAEKPWIGFAPNVENYEYEMSHRIRCTMGLRILAHLDAVTVDSRYTKIENLSDDIIRALRQGVIRSGCAESITLQELQTDQSDPEAYNAGTLTMLFNVVYYRNEPTS